MGQYHLIVNLDRREFLDPHQIDVGLKACEQIASHPSTPAALFILLTCSNGRGGGDFAIDTGTDDDRVIGRWAGDRLAVFGAYAESRDIPAPVPDPVEDIYDLCRDGAYHDVIALVRPVLAAAMADTHPLRSAMPKSVWPPRQTESGGFHRGVSLGCRR